jgi:hypothetical protein
MFDRSSRKTIPEALGSSEAQDVSFCDPPNSLPAVRPAPDLRTQVGEVLTARICMKRRSVVAAAQGRKK